MFCIKNKYTKTLWHPRVLYKIATVPVFGWSRSKLSLADSRTRFEFVLNTKKEEKEEKAASS